MITLARQPARWGTFACPYLASNAVLGLPLFDWVLHHVFGYGIQKSCFRGGKLCEAIRQYSNAIWYCSTLFKRYSLLKTSSNAIGWYQKTIRCYFFLWAARGQINSMTSTRTPALKNRRTKIKARKGTTEHLHNPNTCNPVTNRCSVVVVCKGTCP